MSGTRNLALVCALALVATGCATVHVARDSSFDTATLRTKTLFVVEDVGKLDRDPDNVDGYINLLWTDDEERRRVVEESLQELTEQLRNHGVNVVKDQKAADIVASLFMKSVRDDPVGGWITDGGELVFSDAKSKRKIARVVSGDAFITPTLESTFERFLEGTLDLWGISR